MLKRQEQKMTKKISIVSPCFNEQANLISCYEKVRDIFQSELPTYDYEHIFVDNCSTDETRSLIRQVCEKDSHVKAVFNARNYGPFRSTFNALRHTTGDAVMPMLPVDGQDPPELIPKFVKLWDEGFFKVAGVRAKREEGVFYRFARHGFYRVVNLTANVEITPQTSEYQLLDRRVVDALLRYPDHYPYIRGMIANIGFDHKSTTFEYVWRKRERGRSKNNIYALIDQGLNGLISFSNIPMRLLLIGGFLISAMSLTYALAQTIYVLVSEANVSAGIPTLIVALFFFSGVQLFFLGVLGEYIGAIHSQVRTQNIVVEDELIGIDDQK